MELDNPSANIIYTCYCMKITMELCEYITLVFTSLSFIETGYIISHYTGQVVYDLWYSIGFLV